MMLSQSVVYSTTPHVAEITQRKIFSVPEVHLSQGLQELRANEPIGGVPQSEEVNHQLQTKLTQSAVAHSHDAVLKHTDKDQTHEHA